MHPPPEPSIAPLAPYHHPNLRAAILQTSLQLIEEKGIEGLTLREIGSRLGVSRSAAYRHFASKDVILAALSEQGFREFAAMLAAARATGTDFATRMAAMGLAYQRFAAARRAHYTVMFGWATTRKDNCEVWHPAAQEAFAILESIIGEAQQSGEARGTNSASLARVVWAASHGLALLALETDLSPEGPGTQLALLGADVLCRGMRP